MWREALGKLADAAADIHSCYAREKKEFSLSAGSARLHDGTCILVRTQLFGSLPPTLEGEKRSANLPMPLLISTLVMPERKKSFL